MATVSLMGAPPVTGIEVVQLSYLSWLEEQENLRAAKYAELRNYYEGDQDAQLTKRIQQFLELTTNQEFSLNLCPIVVDSLAEKLKVERFSCTVEAQEEKFEQWWQDNRMDGQQGIVHLGAVRDGDTYVMVEWDNEETRPSFIQENAYDGAEGMHIVYSDEKRMIPVVAIKKWTITNGPLIKTRRTNLYFPDRIEKYTDGGTGKSWQQYVEPEGQFAGMWPIPWTESGTETGLPLGIPVIHFRNKDQGKSYGQGEHDIVIPIQNAENKAVLDLLGAADTTGFRILTAIGFKPAGMVIAPGSWAWTDNPNGKIDSIDPADLSGLIELKDSFAMDAARITRTPLSAFQLTGQVASAGTQKEQRSGLIAKALDRQVGMGNSWEDAMAYGRKLYNVFGPGGLDMKARISTVWKDDEKPDDKELAEEVELLERAGAASTKTKVQRLHPAWTKEEVEAEVTLIQAEKGMAVPDPGPLP